MVKILQHGAPVHLALGDDIKFLLHFSGEVEIHDVVKMLEQEVVYDYADVGGEELGALDPGIFGFGLRVDLAVVERQHAEVTGRSIAVSLFNVTTLLHR